MAIILRTLTAMALAMILPMMIVITTTYNDNDNGDDSPPEINLFVGKFNFPGANESDDAGGWANFDDTFSAVEAEFPSPVVDESPPVFGEYTDQTSAH